MLSSSRMNYWCVGHFLAAVNSYLSLAFVSQAASLFAGASQSSMESSRIFYGWRLIGLYGRHGALSMTSASVRQSHHHHRISWRCAWNGHLESNQFRVGSHQWSTTLLTRYLCRIERAVMHEMSNAMGNCFHREMSNESVQNLYILIGLDHCWQLAQFTS